MGPETLRDEKEGCQVARSGALVRSGAAQSVSERTVSADCEIFY